MTTTKINWNEENTASLTNLAGDVNTPVSQEALVSISEALGGNTRSVGAKLRNLGYSVEKASAKASAWTEQQEAALTALVNNNAGAFTYAEIASSFENGIFNSKQIQGKLLSMELFHLVRKADKVAAKKVYSDDEEAKFLNLAQSGATMEDLVAAFSDKTIASIRGKALSLLRKGEITAMPVQVTSSAKTTGDVLDNVDVANMTVDAIVEATGKSPRGIRSILSRRGITCQDYDGAAKREKLDNK